MPDEDFRVPRHGGGVWAPAIRHHDGRFWIYYPDPDFGIYVTTAAAFGIDADVAVGVGLLIQTQQILPITLIGLVVAPEVRRISAATPSAAGGA